VKTTYTTAEVCKITGISLPVMKSLLRDSRVYRKGTRLFWPQYPSTGRRIPHYFSQQDVDLLREYQNAIKKHKLLLKKMRNLALKRCGRPTETKSGE
jgi:hypothetical protein